MKEGWTYKKLGEVCLKTKNINWSTVDDNDSYYYIDLTSVDRSTLSIVEPQIVTKENAPSRAKQIVSCGDIIFGTTRPTLKRLCIIPEEYDGQICSTGFCVLRPKEDVTSKWVFYAMQTDQFYKYVEPLQVGVNYPAITDGNVREYKIPVPNPNEQQQIISELDLLSDVIEKKKAQIEELDKLAQSSFYDMFGDPVTNDKKWEKTELEKTCLYITDGDHMPPPKANCGIPFITISDIDKVHREIIFDDTFFVPIDYYNSLKEERKAKNGDVLYTVTGSYGIPVVINSDKEFCFQRHIALLRPDKEKLNTSFLCYWVLCDSVKHMADDVATGIAQKTVGLSSLRKFSIILPPLALQQEFAAKVEAIEQMKAKVRQSLKESEELFNSRMDYYFN